MLKYSIINPQILSLLARVRHTNMLVISDRGFPFWPQIETVDISLSDDIPTVLQALTIIRPSMDLAEIIMAEEFREENPPHLQSLFISAAKDTPIKYIPHSELKKCVPDAIGLIRTGDTTQYANMILISGLPVQKEE